MGTGAAVDLGELKSRRKRAGEPVVVGIEQRDPFAARRIDAGVAGGGRATVVVVPDDADVSIPRDVGRQLKRRLRAVVDNDHLHATDTLGQRASQRAFAQRLAIVDRNDD